jgi:hypothetical protein
MYNKNITKTEQCAMKPKSWNAHANKELQPVINNANERAEKRLNRSI